MLVEEKLKKAVTAACNELGAQGQYVDAIDADTNDFECVVLDGSFNLEDAVRKAIEAYQE